MGSTSDNTSTDLNQDIEKHPRSSIADENDPSSTQPDTIASTNAPDVELAPIESKGLSLQRTRTEDYAKRPECFSSTVQEVLFVLTTTFAIAQTSIIFGATCVISSHISDTLGMTQAEVTWITASSSLGSGTFLLFFGKVADLFGRRWLFLFSMALYTVLILVAGFANNPFYMDIMMGAIGLASSGVVPPAIGMLGNIYHKPSSRKNKAFACFSAGNPLGFVIGMIVAGIAFKVASWRATFWVVAVAYAIFTVIAFWTVPEDTRPYSPFNLDTLKKFDFLGNLLAIAGIALFTSALSIATDAPEGWRTPYVITLLVLGAVLLAAFLIWQTIFRHPLMPLYIWKDKNFSLLVSILCLGFIGFSGNSFWLSLYYQVVEDIQPLAIAARMLPMAIVGILVNVIAGLVMHKVSNKLLMAIGALAYCGTFALLSAMSNHSLYWAFAFPALCLSVVGADFQFTVTNMYVTSALPSHHQSIAGAILQAVTRISTSLGLAIQTAVYSSLSSSNDPQISTEFLPYRGVWWVALAASGASLFLLPYLTLEQQGQRKKKRTGNQKERAAVTETGSVVGGSAKQASAGDGDMKQQQQQQQKP